MEDRIRSEEIKPRNAEVIRRPGARDPFWRPLASGIRLDCKASFSTGGGYGHKGRPSCTGTSDSWSRTRFMTLLCLVEICGLQAIDNETVVSRSLNVAASYGFAGMLLSQIYLQSYIYMCLKFKPAINHFFEFWRDLSPRHPSGA